MAIKVILRYADANPKNKKTNDSFIRAMAIASNQKWEDIYFRLATVAIKKGLILTDKKAEETFLKNRDYIKYTQPKKDRVQLSLKEFLKLYGENFKGKTIIFRLRNYTTVCIVTESAAIVYDKANCLDQKIMNYYVKDS